MNERPLWADLHNHNAIGCGKGTLPRSYEIARGCLLDAYCFTPHGLWHDRPASDAKLAEFHAVGWDHVQQSWELVKEKANAENRDGEFTTFLGFEWHSSEYGDAHLVFPGDDAPLIGANDADELKAFARRHGALVIPHHIAYRRGWRGINWAEFDPELSPVVDVFSEHGCGMAADSHWPMLRHSMGGSERSQTMMEELKRGRIAGVIASTDNHFAHPASYGEGLAAIWADGHDRASIFDAIERRHTYALTGDRIGLKVEMGGGMMGDTIPTITPRRLHVAVDAAGEVDYVRVIKNGRAVHSHLPPERSDEPFCQYVVRLEFGWDAMTSPEVTDWHIRAWVRGGQIERVHPCFAGGAGSVEKLNRVLSVAPEEVTFESYTSRLNSRPTSSVVLVIEGSDACRLEVAAAAEYKGRTCGCDLTASLGELLCRDEWGVICDVFSAPKIRAGSAVGCHQTMFEFDWTDPEPRGGGWYLVKVQQRNGHVAWSSPIWCV